MVSWLRNGLVAPRRQEKWGLESVNATLLHCSRLVGHDRMNRGGMVILRALDCGLTLGSEKCSNVVNKNLQSFYCDTQEQVSGTYRVHVHDMRVTGLGLRWMGQGPKDLSLLQATEHSRQDLSAA